jgi:MFS family permease
VTDEPGYASEPGLHEGERLSPAPPVFPGEEPGRIHRAFRLAVVDFGPLRRRRDFRLLFVGQTVSFLGSMVTFVAVPFQAFELTGSSLVVGLIGLVELVPILVTAFVGGLLADAVDRRRMVLFSELAMSASAGALLANSLLPDPQLWVLFLVAGLDAAFYGIQRPSLDALTPRLVERDELPAASALASFRGTFGALVGPALAGGLIAAIGLPATYGFDVATFAFSLLVLMRMSAVPPPPEAERPSLRAVREGLRHARGRPELLGTYFVDMAAMFFGIPEALFPAFAKELGGGPGALGLLYAAPAAGSLLASVTSGWVGRVHRHGVAVILAASGWGVAVVGFGLAPGVPLALACLALAGFADMVSGIFRTTIWNQTIPDHLRGRLAGIEMISYTSGPLLGNVESGVVASFAGIRASAVSGGVLCVLSVGALAAALPGFRRYDAMTPQANAGTL